ncbi:MAG: FprA family A-type flavoprotein [Bacilli bacterium]|nr:FprA family A-type flavoprotein [Bacilli bacterium]
MEIIKENIINVGVEDKDIDLFEAQYKVDGMLYNSYLIIDDKVALLDSVDEHFASTWLENIDKALNGRKIDYLIVQHVEPDHSGSIAKFLEKHKDTTVVGNLKTLSYLAQFFPNTKFENTLVIADNSTLNLGHNELKFIFAPFIHWPEVFVTYVKEQKVLFSADAFGKFGLSKDENDYIDEARRYYIGIVGKYGLQVNSLLTKAAPLEIDTICSLHGPVLKDNISLALSLYKKWATYQSEDEDVLIAYASVYGHTKEACIELKHELESLGKKVDIIDLAREDIYKAISLAFKHKNLVLASITYNATLFPKMNQFIDELLSRNFQNRKVGFIENGTWAPTSGKTMKDKLANAKNLTIIDKVVTVKSALNSQSFESIKELAKAIAE